MMGEKKNVNLNNGANQNNEEGDNRIWVKSIVIQPKQEKKIKKRTTL
jgi:hypothetical protein